MNFVRNNLANAFTLGNLFSGSIGIINLIEGNFELTAICIMISLVLDFFDGFVARAMKSSSNLGAQLDSLADMVSFGLLPGVAMYKMLEVHGNIFLGIHLPFELKYLGLLITLFSCLRLAIFNLDDDQKYYFKGLNTPSNTVLIFGIFYILNTSKQFSSDYYIEKNPFENLAFQLNLGADILVLITVVSSWLLISPIKMIAMKFKSMKISDNISKIVLLLGAILIVLIFGIVGIPLVIIYYIIISLIFQKSLS